MIEFICRRILFILNFMLLRFNVELFSGLLRRIYVCDIHTIITYYSRYSTTPE